MGAVALVMLVALLPWWRNHHYLRDLYDYGIVMAANGRFERGEKPYVDFTTPIQAGFLGLNWMVERAAGGTYAALTLGGAGLIVMTTLVLTFMLARRWPWWAAVTVGGGVAIGAASQHTILWHNPLGVFCLALATWAAACAPILRRSTWPWHLLAAVGLFLGGINKVNFQLVALAVSFAWALRAGLTRQAEWRRVLATAAAILLAGVVLPVGFELAWTGATVPVWVNNVVQLAAGSRSAILSQILSWHFLVRPIHDYYGPLLLPQVGLAGVVLSLAALAGCWPGRAGADRWLALLAVGLAAAAGAALLATNFEIAWIGWSAWLVLITGVWLGFAPGGRRGIFFGGLLAPAVVMGIAAWWSAWLGQRSQFGYSGAPRADYRAVDQFAPFGNLAGLRLPPDFAASVAIVAQTMPDPEADGGRAVFYGSGMDWIERYFPSVPEKGKPLWVHWDTTYDSRHLAALKEKLVNPDGYQVVFATIARDEWPAELREALNKFFVVDLVGPVVRRWTRRDIDSIDFTDSLEVLSRLGGNVDGRMLHFDQYPLAPRRTVEGKVLLGTTRREGQVLLTAPSFRLNGLAVLARLPGSRPGPLAADFKIIVHGAVPENTRWSAHVELPAGQQSIAVPFALDGEGQRLLLWITRPDKSPPAGLAGYRELEINHAVEAGGGAPQLRNGVTAETAASPELAGSLFGPIAWRPQQLVVRGGRPGEAGLELPAGGEMWLHTPAMAGEIRGQFSCPSLAGRRPIVRVFWYKGGRLQIMQQGMVPEGGTFPFHVWTAEPGGWIGATVDAGDEVAPAIMRIDSCTLGP